MNIVIADSSQIVLDLISKQIAENGHHIATFNDGAAALNYIHAETDIDVLLTGLELPNVSGLELCWEASLRSQQGKPAYVIVMSSSSDVEKLIEALDTGADDFLRKPFVKGELFARLRAAERTLTQQAELFRLALTDPLTGVSNRRSFFDQSANALYEHRNDDLGAVIMLDIDHFKKVNDFYGHDAGDIVLQEVSKALNGRVPIFGRLGGEEFAAFLPEAHEKTAFKKAEELRQTIAGLPITASGKTLSVTGSFGISIFKAGDNVDSLLKRADGALYEAKKSGRNCCVIWESKD